MGFAVDLLGKKSHESLLHLQDKEIKVLETFKRCMTMRIHADNEYAQAIGNIVNTANKIDVQPFSSPFFQTWKTLIKQSEGIQKALLQNTERLSTKTMHSLTGIINEKKALRKMYADERERLETEFTKLQEDLHKQKSEFEKIMEKVTHDRARYEDLLRKGKMTNKFEESRNKYLKSSGKLHRTHNDYILLIRDINQHQRNYLHTVLPALLDFQQERLQSLLQQSKEVLEEYSELTDTSSHMFAQCNRAVKADVASINPTTEFDSFIANNK